MKTIKPFLLGLSLTAALAVSGCTSLGVQPSVDYQNQKQVSELVQTGMRYYWEGGDLLKVEQEFFKGITLKGNYDVVEASFAEATRLAPYRLDLRFGLASTQIIKKDISEAQATYLDILRLDPDNFDAGILYGAYAKLSGDSEQYSTTISRLSQRFPEKTADYLQKFQRADAIQSVKLNTDAKTKSGGNLAIVILGYALSHDGSMRPTLVERLQQGLVAANMNPDAAIIVSGGVPHGGVTEAYVMQQWLIEHGISRDRIYLDDRAKDTVGNAVYSSRIMARLGTEQAIVVSSASHMRRALVVFDEVSRRNNLNIDFDNLVAMDFSTSAEAMQVSANEQLVIYRDMLRASGLWAYPGIQI